MAEKWTVLVESEITIDGAECGECAEALSASYCFPAPGAPGGLIVVVDPCPRCLDEANATGYESGRKD